MLPLSSTATAALLPIGVLTARDRAEMLGLYKRYYVRVENERFFADLDRKERIAIVRDADGRISAFTSMTTLDLSEGNDRLVGLFSGDTIVDSPGRQYPHLAALTVSYAEILRQRFQGTKVYYVLLSKGWRTFRAMSTFFREYAPRVRGRAPAHCTEVIDRVGRFHFPGQYMQSLGIIRYAGGGQSIRPGSAEDIQPGRDIADQEDFLALNPGYLQGDEIICVADCAPGNRTRNYERVIESASRDGMIS